MRGLTRLTHSFPKAVHHTLVMLDLHLEAKLLGSPAIPRHHLPHTTHSIRLVKYMELSIRHKFGKEDGCDTIPVFSGYWSWEEYIDWIKLQHLDQVRTYDSILNPIIGNSTSIVSNIGLIAPELPLLVANNLHQYLQLAINTAEEDIPLLPHGFRLLGYDLVENGYAISSLLNCGPWEGELAQFTAHLNEFGLLGLEEVKQAEVLLPIVWGRDEPHAFADVWAIFEVNTNDADLSSIVE